MMGFLIADIVCHSRHIRFRQRECAIRALPFEEFIRRDFVRDQVRRRAFGFFEQGRNCQCGWQANKQMQVIVNSPSHHTAFA